MQDRPIDKVLEQLEDYTERGNEIRARCPAHNGTSEDSLSIREAENGDVLLHCHAECDNEDIVEALDLDLERVMNSIRNSLGMQETEIAREPSRLWNPHFYAIFAQVHNTL